MTRIMDDPTTSNGGEHTGRVWRACLECRKKKSKCDGKDVCRPCRTRNRECIYPESKDNASSSRQFAATLDARCQQMDSLCQRMDTLMGKFNEIAESLGSLRRADLVSAIPTAAARTVHEETGIMQQQIDSFLLDEEIDMSADMGHQAMDEDAEEEETGDESSSGAESKTQDHVMTTDSYGKLRYVGGTGTMVMIEALKSLSPESLAQSPIDSRSPEKASVSKLELPFFVRGQTWPKLPFLPQAEQLLRPPRYVSDLLINLYFDQLHFTMPVIYRPHFMQRYNILLNSRPDSPPDTAFLSVFFAVCACASGLLPREPGNSSIFTGLKYYESALLLHYASTGEGSIEQVQCLALLSMCTAGWNTLAQSWKFAGQAVRAAQDLGLHRSPARGAGEVLKEELCRRIWWSIYCLDRLLSICLGRPMGVEDSDCDCELPLDMDDGELEIYSKQSPETRRLPQGTSRLAGFISLSVLCRISGKIVRAMNPLKAHRRRKGYAAEQLRTAAALDTELREWLETIPDSVKFSANNTMDLDFGSPHLTMCAIIYVVHVGSVINLHRPLIPDKDHGSNTVSENPSFKQCIHAASGCIRAGELLQERVPPSHHLAFCTHYLALSGVFLIRSSQSLKEDYTTDIETCIRSLASLETVWTGARRSRLILEELMKHSGTPKNIDWGLIGDFAPLPHDELTEYMLRQETNDFNFGGLEFT